MKNDPLAEVKAKIKELGEQLFIKKRELSELDTGTADGYVKKCDLEYQINDIQEKRTELGFQLLEHDRLIEQEKLGEASKKRVVAAKLLVDIAPEFEGFMERLNLRLSELGNDYLKIKGRAQEIRALANKAARLSGNERPNEMEYLKPEVFDAAIEKAFSEAFGIDLRPMDKRTKNEIFKKIVRGMKC